MVWLILIMVALALALLHQRMRARVADEDDLPGLAILEFGRAFPGEAIRSLHTTADSRSVFLRLHDGKTGFMQSQGRHSLCHLIEPGRVNVEATGGAALDIRFADFHGLSGIYTFRTPDDAADVALWILSGFTARPIEPPPSDGC